MDLLILSGTDPCRNLAAEEYALHHLRQGSVLMLWRNRPTVVVGRYQNTLEEIHSAYVEREKIQVVRRNTGGGCVYHDLGNLNYSLILDAAAPEELRIEAFTGPVIQALRALGVPAEDSGRNDIVVGGRKISGCAQVIEGGRLLHHGTLLFSADLEAAEQALCPAPEKFVSKSTKSVSSRMTNLAPLLPPGRRMGILQFRDYLARAVAPEGQKIVLDPGARREIRRLAEEKYRSWEWTYGQSPQFAYRDRHRFPGGTLETGLSVEDGRICAVSFRGDFLSLRPVAEVEQALRGCPLRQEDLQGALAPFSMAYYFGTIQTEDVIRCLLDGWDRGRQAILKTSDDAEGDKEDERDHSNA